LENDYAGWLGTWSGLVTVLLIGGLLVGLTKVSIYYSTTQSSAVTDDTALPYITGPNPIHPAYPAGHGQYLHHSHYTIWDISDCDPTWHVRGTNITGTELSTASWSLDILGKIFLPLTIKVLKLTLPPPKTCLGGGLLYCFTSLHR
jgi:hypothetical protein